MTWKKVIVSGSDAALKSLTLDTALGVVSGGTGVNTIPSGQVVLGAGTGAITTVARNNITGNTKVIVTNGAQTILGGSAVTLDIGGTIASGSRLNDISALTPTDSNIIVGNGTTWVAESGTTARTSLGLGTTDNVTFNTVNAASFTGSFKGDGSGLTGLTTSAVTTYTNSVDNRVITSTGGTGINAEANLTFDGSAFAVTGTMTVSGNVNLNGNTTIGDAGTDSLTLNSATITAPNIAADTGNNVVIRNASNQLKVRSIDGRAWGTTLTETPAGVGVSTRVPFYTNANTLSSNASLTYNGTVLAVNGSTFGNDVIINGNLKVNGTQTVLNTTNLAVNDKFILLNSGSSTGDGGIIVQAAANYSGSAFGWHDATKRWAIQSNTKLGSNAIAMAPDSYVSVVVDVDGGNTDIPFLQKNGNIKIQSGDIYIFA